MPGDPEGEPIGEPTPCDSAFVSTAELAEQAKRDLDEASDRTDPLGPFGDIDDGAVAAFWARAIEHGAVDPGTPAPQSVERFGDSREMADELLDLVIDGPKRATAGSIADFEREGVPLPAPGTLWIVADGDGNPRAVLRTADIRVGPLSSVDDAFAWDEGEGDRTRAWWLAAHERHFRRTMEAAGEEFTTDMPTVFERFEVAYAEPAPAGPGTETA